MASTLETLAEDLTDAVASHALATGYFDRFNFSNPDNPVGTGLTGSAWANNGTPYALASGLNKTTLLIVMQVRLYKLMMEEPQDAIEPDMLKALGALMEAYSSDFTLDGLIRNVDLLGETGVPLGWIAGYLPIDQTRYRVVTITVPCIINNVFNQAP